MSEGEPSTTIVNLEDTDNGRINVTVHFDGWNDAVREKREGGSAYLFVSLDKAQQVDVVVPLVVEHLNGRDDGRLQRRAGDGDDPGGGETAMACRSGLSRTPRDDDGEGIRVRFGDLPDGVKADPRRKRGDLPLSSTTRTCRRSRFRGHGREGTCQTALVPEVHRDTGLHSGIRGKRRL